MYNFPVYIFDLDGTILDSNPINIESFNYTCRKHLGREVTPHEITLLFGKPLKEQMQHFCKEKALEMMETYRNYMDKIHDEKISLFPDTKEVLKQLNEKGVRCALVTSKTKSFAERALKIFELQNYFEVKVFHEDCTNHKPHPEPYIKAIKKLNINPSDALSIGDSPYDIIASKKAGLKTAIVAWTEFPEDIIKKLEPDYIINNLKELVHN